MESGACASPIAQPEDKKKEKSRILGEHRDFLEASGVAPINQVSDGALYRELE